MINNKEFYFVEDVVHHVEGSVKGEEGVDVVRGEVKDGEENGLLLLLLLKRESLV
jgi:hypothetical protein